MQEPPALLGTTSAMRLPMSHGYLVACLAVLAPLAAARAAHAQSAPRIDDVRGTLCAAHELSESECARAVFTPVGSLDLEGDGPLEWIFVLTRGGPEICHVRHACFSIVQSSAAGWSAILRGIGGTVGLTSRPRSGPRDLVVTAANSAEEQTVTVYRWRGRRLYRRLRAHTCSHVGPPRCAPIPDEIVLQ